MSRKPQRVNDERLKELWPTRLRDRDLADKLGHSRGTLHRRAKAIGLKPRRDIWREAHLQLGENDAQLLAEFAAREGCTKTEAARRIVQRFLRSRETGEAFDAV